MDENLAGGLGADVRRYRTYHVFVVEVRRFRGAPSSRDPVRCRGEQEFLQRNAVAADQQLPLRLKGLVKGVHPRKPLLAGAALDLNGNYGLPETQYEIDLPAALAPVEQFDARSCSAVDQMRADRRFRQPAPELPVLSRFIRGQTRLCADERRVQYKKLGARRPLADLIRGELLQARQHAGAGQQFQVVGQSRRIAGILKLPDHLLVGKDLSREGAAELEKAPEQRGLVDPRQKQDVAGKGRLDERIDDVARPALPVGNQVGRTGIAAEIDIAVKIPSESLPHFGIGPVGHGNDFKAAGEAFGQSPLNQERRRSQEKNLEGQVVAGVAVPQPFDHLGPAGHLLDLVQHQKRPALALRLGIQEPSRFPLLLDPCPALKGGLVRGGIMDRYRGIVRNLVHERGLPRLPWPGEDLDEPAWFLHPFDQRIIQWAMVHLFESPQ